MVELGVRYRAGRDPVTITHPGGRTSQLKPFERIRFSERPVRIVGRLYRVPRTRRQLETMGTP